ncbi:MAG: hypothetical protein WAV54_14830 [Acidimicrobiales bacterium]
MAPELAVQHRAWGWFAAWTLVGATWSLALIGIASIGLLVLPAAVGATVVVALRAPSSNGLAGLVTGLGLPALWVAYLNRSGPGNVCTSGHGVESCIQALDPWPWLGVTVVLVTAGIAIFLVHGPRRYWPT